MNNLLRNLQKLHKICSRIEPDSIAIYEALSSKKRGTGDGGMADIDGHDLAFDLKLQLNRMNEAIGEAHDNFRAFLVAEEIANHSGKYIP